MGLSTADLVRKHSFSEQTFYRWKSKYGGMELSDTKRLKQLEEKTAAEIARENDIAPAQISEWKKQLEERLGEVFQSKGENSKELQS